MEIKEFAEIILFSPSIEDKLTKVNKFSDNKPSHSLILPKLPARSENIKFESDKNKRNKFPNASDLDQDYYKAVVLHFFANHELLALELMALILLKFPDAPKKFRHGIARCILEEQEHMRLYIHRMNELGMEFGDISVNDFFWKCISNVKDLKEFVATMSLTLEQANLDFSLYYKNLFKQIGDDRTTAILQQVYDDEIGHVKLGVHWLDQWKNKNETQWDSYVNSLVFPMGPQRAKTKQLFDEEGRRRAGLNEEFIKKIKLFSSSKERPSRLLLFNPEVEEEILADKLNYTPTKQAQEIKKSLACIMSIASKDQDMVLLHEKPSDFYLEQLQFSGLPYPEFWTAGPNNKDLKSQLSKHLGQRKLECLMPWGWTKSMELKRIGLEELCIDSKRCVLSENLNKLNSQLYSAELLKEFIKNYNYEFLIDPRDLALEVDSWSQVLNYINSRVEMEFVLKKPLSMSGRGILFFKKLEELESVEKWFRATIKKQKKLLIEPKFERIMDFSLQFDFSPQANRVFKGIARFESGDFGNYKGGVIHPILHALPNDLCQFWNGNGHKPNPLFESFGQIQSFLQTKMKENKYEYIVGLDCFIYRKNNEIKFKPFVEMNMRMNMGWLKVLLKKYVHSSSLCQWRIMPKKELLKLVCKDKFSSVALEHPIKMKNSKITEGIVFLSDPLNSGDFVATMFVGEKANHLLCPK